MTGTTAAIIRDLACLHGMGLAAAGQIPRLTRRARARVDRWNAVEASNAPRHEFGCPVCGAPTSGDCRAYAPESDACYRHA